MKALLIAVLLLAFLVGSVFLAWDPSRAVAVRTVEAVRGDVEAVLTTNGRIEAGSRYEVAAETTGRILRTPAGVGDAVERGQALAVIDDRDARQDLEGAEARLAAARAELGALEVGLPEAERAELESRVVQLEADLRDQEADLRQAQRLVEKKALAALEVELAERRINRTQEELALVRRKLEAKPADPQVDLARARNREAEAAVAAARARVGSATVRAPIDGVVYSLPVERGVFVRPGDPVARLAGAEAPRARLLIDEPELGKLRLGAEATLTADAFPDQQWKCRIDRLPAEVVESGTRRVGEARCTVELRESRKEIDRLIPNLTVDVSIAVDRAKNVVTLPREAVTREGGEDFVWVAEEGRARRQPVEVGLRSRERVEIRQGVQEGDRVLAPGAETLAEGDPVEIDGA